MKAHFFELAGRLHGELQRDETLLCSFSGERSDFVRFNRAKVRQAGSVAQRSLSLRLVRGQRQAGVSLELAGNGEDATLASGVLATLRQALEGLPEDPWLFINQSPRSTQAERRGVLPSPGQMVAEVLAGAGRQELVGIYAGGTICRGFANSLGQRNWHEVDSFNLDFSLYLQGDQAVKSAYAGFAWDEPTLRATLEAAARELEYLKLPRKTMPPGEYRVYLAPRALEEIVGLLAWGGFSARARATRQSPLLRMQEGARLSAKVSLTENTAQGVAPDFQGDGFLKPPGVPLIVEGRLADALVSPRSAKEFGLATNAAGASEAPESLDLAAGGLDAREALGVLGTGLYIGNLWYLNYSDRPAARITGMTRFATFWVEEGRITAPVTPLRFDDTLYRMLGENLVDLTRGRTLLLDPSTYEGRSSASARLPGALLSALKFTL